MAMCDSLARNQASQGLEGLAARELMRVALILSEP